MHIHAQSKADQSTVAQCAVEPRPALSNSDLEQQARAAALSALSAHSHFEFRAPSGLRYTLEQPIRAPSGLEGTPEQPFRAPSGLGGTPEQPFERPVAWEARPSSHFERPVVHLER